MIMSKKGIEFLRKQPTIQLVIISDRILNNKYYTYISVTIS